MRNPFRRKRVVEVRLASGEVQLTRDSVAGIDSSTVERQIEKMRDTTRKLDQLLAKSEPGLLTWYQAVGQCLRVFKDIHDGTWNGN